MAISPIQTNPAQFKEPIDGLQTDPSKPTHNPGPKVGPATIVTLSNTGAVKSDPDGDGD